MRHRMGEVLRSCDLGALGGHVEGWSRWKARLPVGRELQQPH